MSAQYADALKAAGFDGPRAAAAPSGPGSVEEWAYYQFGVPAFAVDFWSPPLPAAADSSVAVASADAGDESVGVPARPAPAPADSTAAAAPKPDPSLAALAAFAADHPGANLWRPWKRVELPDGRAAMVGGPAPAAMRTPPPAMVDSLLSGQTPALLELADWLPRLAKVELKSEPRGGGVWLITARVHNDGRLPYPTAQGSRTRRPAPVALTLAGAEVLEGPARRTVDAVPALGSAESQWLVRAKKNARVDVTASAPGFGEARASLTPAEEGGRR